MVYSSVGSISAFKNLRIVKFSVQLDESMSYIGGVGGIYINFLIAVESAMFQRSNFFKY